MFPQWKKFPPMDGRVGDRLKMGHIGLSQMLLCCYNGNNIFEHPNSKNFAVAQIFNFCQETLFFVEKPFLFNLITDETNIAPRETPQGH